ARVRRKEQGQERDDSQGPLKSRRDAIARQVSILVGLKNAGEVEHHEGHQQREQHREDKKSDPKRRQLRIVTPANRDDSSGAAGPTEEPRVTPQEEEQEEGSGGEEKHRRDRRVSDARQPRLRSRQEQRRGRKRQRVFVDVIEDQRRNESGEGAAKHAAERYKK